MPNLIRVTSRRMPAQQIEQRTVAFVLSTDVEDRAGDRVMVEGWKLDNYMRNPVVLWGHDHSTPAIGRMTRVGVENGALVGAVQFATAEQHPFADTIYRLVEGDFIAAGSVGFIPHKWAIREDRGIDYLENELLEYSVVNIPMNPQCLARAVASGIDIAPLAKAADAENAGSYAELREKLLASNARAPQPQPLTPSLDFMAASVRNRALRLRAAERN